MPKITTKIKLKQDGYVNKDKIKLLDPPPIVNKPKKLGRMNPAKEPTNLMSNQIHTAIINHYKFLVKNHLKEAYMIAAYKSLKLNSFRSKILPLKLNSNAIKLTNQQLNEALSYADRTVLNDLAKVTQYPETYVTKSVEKTIGVAQAIHMDKSIRNVNDILPNNKNLAFLLAKNNINHTKIVELFDKDFNANTYHLFKALGNLKETHTIKNGKLTLSAAPLSNQLSSATKQLRNNSVAVAAEKRKMQALILGAKQTSKLAPANKSSDLQVKKSHVR